MKKRIFTLLALILCVVMCIGLVACGGSESSPPELPPSEGGDEAPPSEGETPPSENEGTTEGYSGLEFSYSEDSTYILVDMSNCTGTDVVVPSTYNGVPVTRIYGSAFESYPELKSIYIPESIEDVDAFDLKACTKLECITVDEKNQTYMSINGSLYKKNPMTLEYYVHRNGETEFTVPDEVEKIGSSAFDGASALTKIILSKSVTEIYKYSFDGCSNLQYNEYDNGLYLGTKDNPYFALVGAKSEDITACEINTNAKIIGGYSFSNCSNLQSIAVPNSVTRICVGAFSQCIALSNVVLSTSIKAVEDYTFDGCINLSMFYIPEGVTYLGDAFGEIENLMAISIPNSISEIGNNAFFWLNRLMYNRYEDATYLGNTENPYAVLIRGGNSGIIHEDTRVIYTEAFEGRNVTSVIIPDSVISIQDGAFWKCESLESITIGKGVKYIGYDAFNCCSSLKKITIPDNVERVDGSAFSGCSSLEEITIGKGIDKISSAMLSGCSSLKNIEIPDNIKSISANAFGGCSSLTEIRIPSSVTSISDAEFKIFWLMRVMLIISQ